MWVKLSDGKQINLNGVLYFSRELKEITLMSGEVITLTTSDAEIIEGRIEGNRNRDNKPGGFDKRNNNGPRRDFNKDRGPRSNNNFRK